MRRFLLTVLILFSMAAVYAGEGAVDLNIMNYKPSCNCTKVELPQTLGPGQTGQIRIITNTVGKQGENTITVLFDANTSQRDYVIRIVLDIVP
ncbi:DUF1573 domain-containing protein [Alistipes sp.]|uniref:DUF1573 domain-containing protein n=1 Tax=Alistipes sp. TaxID=1872444 RepID=UPI00307D3CCE